MSEVIGLEGKAYVSEDLLGDGPTWQEIDIASEITGEDSRNQAAIKDRRSQFEKYKLGQRVITYSVTMTYVKGDEVLSVLRDAYDSNTPIGFASMTGDITENGEEGFMFDALVAEMGKPEPFEDVWTVDVVFVPTSTETEPAFVTVGAGT
jgi:hypothetical protein